MYKEIDGDIVAMGKQGLFDVILHGCNCFATMGAGLAPLMAAAFGCDRFEMEGEGWSGDINKLGTIDYEVRIVKKGIVYHPKAVPTPKGKHLIVVNCYSQYGFGKNHKNGSIAPIDYEALTLCLRKINHIFAGKKVATPAIGTGLAGGDLSIVKKIIQTELKDCDVTFIIYKPELTK